MKMNKGNPLDLTVEQDEVLSVLIVRSTDLVDLVNYSLNGTSFPGTKPKSEPLAFPVHRTGNLGVTVHYVDNDVGSFSIQATGDHGGDVSVFSDSQSPKESFRTFIYKLTVK
jgi:hypothetical protein